MGDKRMIVRDYRTTTIATIASGKFLTPHAKVTGKVLKVISETDGDIHIRLSDGTNFIICEIIPELPLPKPRTGKTITIWGIVRYDGEHKWWELHPVIGWQ